jgi:hypothetical protein
MLTSSDFRRFSLFRDTDYHRAEAVKAPSEFYCLQDTCTEDDSQFPTKVIKLAENEAPELTASFCGRN